VEITSRTSHLSGTVDVPGSKSHTIRAVIIASLAHGESVIKKPLDSLDTRSCAAAVRAFGADIVIEPSQWKVTGVGNDLRLPDNVIDVGNSGTTLYMIMGTAALARGHSVITGDHQIRRRSASPLIDALNSLGAEVISTRNNGMAPVVVKGRMRGGHTSVAGISSQYVSSLLMSCPLAAENSTLKITELNERPYVHMTLDWLDYQGIQLEYDDDLSSIHIEGGQSYNAFSRSIPGDFSTATFPLCAGALAGGEVILNGLEMDDPQGDKAVIDILSDMGAEITFFGKSVSVRGGTLKGVDADMNAIPDALPMLSVCACYAGGTTVLHNVKQARMKETDRIAVMAAELKKLGADVEELPDGLRIKGTGLKGGSVHGHGDHRVVMALTIAGFAAEGPVTVDTAESAGITYPGFWDTMRSLGAKIEERV